jgi:hypothetical protein
MRIVRNNIGPPLLRAWDQRTGERMLNSTSTAIACLSLAGLLMSSQGLAQESHDEANQEAHEETHHRYAVAGFVGSTRVGSDNEFTLGVEAGMHLNSKWSIGAVIERAERERHSTLVMVGVGWHPIGAALRFQLGLGRKDPSGKEETVVRTAVAYEIELRDRWFLKPYLAVDFIEDEENEEVFGVYIGRGF